MALGGHSFFYSWGKAIGIVESPAALPKECAHIAHIANPYLWATKSLLAIAHLAMHFSMPCVIDKAFITLKWIEHFN